MSITTPLQAADNGSTSRTVLNDNFTAVEVAIEAVVNDGAPLATTSVAGRSRLSAAPVDATIPIAVGTNDTRMNVGAGMTVEEKAILVAIEAGTYFPAPQVVTFTSSGTWTKDAGLKYVVVEVQAVGGAGAAGVDGGSFGTPGGGGGAGGYTKELILASALGATETVTIGVAASSSFGSLCSATHGANASSDNGGAGGVGSGGDINVGGGDGSQGENSSASDTLGGNGGNSFYGAGGRGGRGSNEGANSNGSVGKNYGGGGGGGGANDSGTQGTGAAGGPAIVIVTEYY